MRKIFTYRIGICVLLYSYQAVLDLKKASLVVGFKNLQADLLPSFKAFTVADYPLIFIFLYIIHRAFIHGLIVRVFTGNKKLLKYYVALDLLIFGFGIPVVLIGEAFPEISVLTDALTTAVLRLLDTPLLLLFFLPSYYLFKRMEVGETNKGSEKGMVREDTNHTTLNGEEVL